MFSSKYYIKVNNVMKDKEQVVGLTLWCNGAAGTLDTGMHLRIQVRVPASLFLIQLPADASGKAAEDDQSTWDSATNMTLKKSARDRLGIQLREMKNEELNYQYPFLMRKFPNVK